MITYEINSHDYDYEKSKAVLDLMLEKARKANQYCSISKIVEVDHTLSSTRISYKYNFSELQ